MRAMILWGVGLIMMAVSMAAGDLNTMLFNVSEWGEQSIQVFQLGAWIIAMGMFLKAVIDR